MAASEIGSSYAQVKVPSKSLGAVKGPIAEVSQPSSTSAHVVSSISRPSSNYSSRSSQIIGVQKGIISLLYVSLTSSCVVDLTLYVKFFWELHHVVCLINWDYYYLLNILLASCSLFHLEYIF